MKQFLLFIIIIIAAEFISASKWKAPRNHPYGAPSFHGIVINSSFIYETPAIMVIQSIAKPIENRTLTREDSAYFDRNRPWTPASGQIIMPVNRTELSRAHAASLITTNNLFVSCANQGCVSDLIYHKGLLMSSTVTIYSFTIGSSFDYNWQNSIWAFYHALRAWNMYYFFDLFQYGINGPMMPYPTMYNYPSPVSTQPVTTNDLISRLIVLFNNNQLPLDENGVYMFHVEHNTVVYPPTALTLCVTDQFGTSQNAFHSYFRYTNKLIKYAVVGNCLQHSRDGSGGFDHVTLTAIHELTKVLTNPDISGGYYTDYNSPTTCAGQEIGDLCERGVQAFQQLVPFYDPFGDNTFLMQKSWNQQKRICWPDY